MFIPCHALDGRCSLYFSVGGSVEDPIPCVPGHNCSYISYQTGANDCGGLDQPKCPPGDAIESKLVSLSAALGSLPSSFADRLSNPPPQLSAVENTVFAQYLPDSTSSEYTITTSRDRFNAGTWSITFPQDKVRHMLSLRSAHNHGFAGGTDTASD